MKPVILRPGIGDKRPSATLYYGRDTRESLRALPAASVHTVCTSPPYWGLRDYGTATWEGGDDAECEHRVRTTSSTAAAIEVSTLSGDKGTVNHSKEGFRTVCKRCGARRVDSQIGLEESPEAFATSLVEVFREVARVLRPDGTLWLNLGDSYVGGGRAGKNPEYQAQHTMFGKTVDGSSSGQFGLPMGIPEGLKPKDLAGIPWRVAFALQADGWYLRSAIPWIKRNCMPSSQTDRPTTGVEYVFLFAHPDSGGRYYYDIDATRVSPNTKPQRRLTARREHSKGGEAAPGAKVRPPNYETSAEPTVACTPSDGRNRRDTDWFFESVEHVASGGQGLLSSEDGSPLAFVVNPKPYSGAHFAVWPPELVRPMIRAGSSEHGVCADCGAPWEKEMQSSTPYTPKNVSTGGDPSRNDGGSRIKDPTGKGGNVLATVRRAGAWQPSCNCTGLVLAHSTVLDPFSGSATTGMVALQEGRNYIGLDLNPHYLPLAEARVQELPAPVADESDSSGDILDLFGGGN